MQGFFQQFRAVNKMPKITLSRIGIFPRMTLCPRHWPVACFLLQRGKAVLFPSYSQLIGGAWAQ
jgi:hypothetical protein